MSSTYQSIYTTRELVKNGAFLPVPHPISKNLHFNKNPGDSYVHYSSKNTVLATHPSPNRCLSFFLPSSFLSSSLLLSQAFILISQLTWNLPCWVSLSLFCAFDDNIIGWCWMFSKVYLYYEIKEKPSALNSHMARYVILSDCSLRKHRESNLRLTWRGEERTDTYQWSMIRQWVRIQWQALLICGQNWEVV